ncbi:hypothetical protein ICE59_003234 [Salmonella enterica subsp. enterica serovar Agama]|nr:hypothetical protein [Salmonella enterica subsp. enterica serovar Enteritidis]EGF4598792.1 hypothetical protein [Salmonella enterica subsp. enterica serovar Agama]
MGEGAALIAAGLVGMGSNMGLLGGSGSASSSSTSHTTSWLDQYVEPIVENFISDYSGINYENSTVAGLTPAEQAALDRAGSGSAIDTGTSIAQGGASLVDEALDSIQGLLNGNAKTQFMSGVSGLYNSASGFMEGQDNAIENDVYSSMGAAFGQSAQSNMASTAVSGSSAAEYATSSILSSGANEMIQRESQLAESILKGAVGLTGGAISGEVGLLDQLMGAGGSIFQTGAKMAESGEKNQFNAGLFEQWFNQQVDNNNRKNDMINNNMPLINFSVLMEEILPTAGIDTTTTTNSKTKQSRGGLL